MSVYICIGNVLFLKQSFLKYVFKYIVIKSFVFLKKNQYLHPQVLLTFTMFERTIFHSATAKNLIPKGFNNKFKTNSSRLLLLNFRSFFF